MEKILSAVLVTALAGTGAAILGQTIADIDAALFGQVLNALSGIR